MTTIRFQFGALTLDAELLDTPVSRGDEIRLASPVNISAKTLGDVTALKVVKAGTTVKASLV